jgi:hypothetical protein
MPRKKLPDRAGPVQTRSRSGCKECRASHVRCDSKKPVCSRCREKGLACSTPFVLKWESEYTSRGLAFGRAGVWNKSGGGQGQPASPETADPDVRDWCDIPAVRSWGFVNSGVATFEKPYLVDVAGEWVDALSDSGWRNGILPNSGTIGDRRAFPVNASGYASLCMPEPKPAAPLSLFPDVSVSNQGRFFEYYLQQVCPRTTPSSQVSSPFASLILPFCLSASPTLFKTIEALGACHWSRFNSVHAPMGLRLKSEGLRDLRRRLTMQGSSTCSTDPEILVIMMMLCLYEIVDNCDQHWTVHLKGAKQLIKLRRHQAALPSPRPPQDPVSAFAERFFAFQDVMGRTACGEEVLFGSDYWQENERSVDPWMGCSHGLVSILSSITEMTRSRRHLSSDSRESFSRQALSLENKLGCLTHEAGDDKILQSVAELKRLAAVLYLHCALYGASPSTPLVVDHVRKILGMVSDLLESGSLVSVTWPVFVAAVELDPLQDEIWTGSDCETVVHGRALVLRALAAMAESTVSNVARTRAVAVKVWQARDLDLLKGPAEESVEATGCNDWEWYVAPISTAMSLA